MTSREEAQDLCHAFLVELVPRYFATAGSTPSTDPDGFILTGADTLFTIEAVLDLPAALITAPPWLGKSFVAKNCEAWLQQQGFEVVLTDLSHTCAGTPPQGPSVSSLSPPKKGCIWLVDSVDEDRNNFALDILNRIGKMVPEARRLLRIVLFARESLLRKEVVEKFDAISMAHQDGRARKAHLTLLPLDRRTAETFVGAERFQGVLECIRENKLQTLAAFPCVLKCLSKRVGVPQTLATIWREVLTDVLEDPRDAELSNEQRPTLETRFDACAMLAAALTFSGLSEVNTVSSRTSLDALLSRSGAHGESLIAAGRHSLDSAAFTRTPSGWRFRDQHVREWFAGFALSDGRKSRLQSLFGHPLKDTGHLGVLTILEIVTKHDSVRDWIRASFEGLVPILDSAPPSLSNALNIIKTLRAKARKGLPSFQMGDLARLRVGGLADSLAVQLGEDEITPEEVCLLLEIAQVTNATSVVPGALVLICTTETDSVRQEAAHCISNLANENQLASLSVWCSTFAPGTQKDRCAQATIIRALRRHSLISIVKAAIAAPLREPWIIDSVALLQSELQEDIRNEPQAARQVLHALYLRSSTDDQARRDLADVELGSSADEDDDYDDGESHPDFLSAAVESIVSQEEQLDEDVAIVTRCLFDIKIPRAVEDAAIIWIARSLEGRRTFFLEGLKRDPRMEGLRTRLWRWILTSEDVPWLFDVIRRSTSTCSERLVATMFLKSQRDEVVDATRSEVHEFLRHRFPGILERIEAEQKASQAAEASIERRMRRKRKISPSIGIVEKVTEILHGIEAESVLYEEAVVNLSWVCFSRDELRGLRIVGEWSAVPEESRLRVLQVCAKWFRSAPATPLPTGSSFPVRDYLKAVAFIRVFRELTEFKLDASNIEHHLPAVLAMCSERCDDLVLAACVVDRVVTENVVFAEIIRRLGIGPVELESSSFLGVDELWDGSLAERVEAIVKNEAIVLQSRGVMLRLLAKRARVAAARIAEAWATAASRRGVEDGRIVLGLDVWLSLEPVVAVQWLTETVRLSGSAVLSKLPSLHAYTGSPIEFAKWPSEAVGGLLALLLEHYPPDEDPPRKLGMSSPSDEYQLRFLRDSLLRILNERNWPDDESELRRVGRENKWLSKRLAEIQDIKEARFLLGEAGRLGASPFLPIEQVVRLLHDARYRIIRDDHDLLLVLSDEIGEIAKNSAEHLSCLYRPKVRGRRRPRQRLHEEAIQAYLFCRLSDRLPSVLEKTRLFCNREALATRDERTDILVEAQTFDGRGASVVVEVKWSDNAGILIDLVAQLGKRYLSDASRQMGIYVVGWCGKSIARLVSMDQLLQQLRSRAREFGSENPGVEIEVVALDMSWRSAGEASKPRPLTESSGPQSRSKKKRAEGLGRLAPREVAAKKGSKGRVPSSAKTPKRGRNLSRKNQRSMKNAILEYLSAVNGKSVATADLVSLLKSRRSSASPVKILEAALAQLRTAGLVKPVGRGRWSVTAKNAKDEEERSGPDR